MRSAIIARCKWYINIPSKKEKLLRCSDNSYEKIEFQKTVQIHPLPQIQRYSFLL